MKHALRTLSLLALMAHAVPLAALAPADIARLEQEVRAAITAEDFLIAQDLIARLEGAGARATAQPLMVQLSKALEKRAIGAAELQRQYRNLEARELKPLRRLRQELEARVKQLEADLTRARDFGYQQRDKVDALQRQFNTLEQKAQNTSNKLAEAQNQREQIKTAYKELTEKFVKLQQQAEADRGYANQATQEMEKLDKQIADLEQRNKELTDNVTTLQKKAQQAQSQEIAIKQLQEQVRLNQDAFNELRSNLENVSNSVQRTANGAAQMSVTELQTAISEIADAVKALL